MSLTEPVTSLNGQKNLVELVESFDEKPAIIVSTMGSGKTSLLYQTFSELIRAGKPSAIIASKYPTGKDRKEELKRSLEILDFWEVAIVLFDEHCDGDSFDRICTLNSKKVITSNYLPHRPQTSFTIIPSVKSGYFENREGFGFETSYYFFNNRVKIL